MSRYHQRPGHREEYPSRHPRYEHPDYNRGRMSYRREDANDYYTPTGRDIYVNDENISGRMTPMGYDYRTDEYDYEYRANGPDWEYDSNNDYGLYSADRMWDYGGHGASGYAGPYWGKPEPFARRENAIFRPYPGRYGREQVYPMNFGPTRPQWPQPHYRENEAGRPYEQRDRNRHMAQQDNYYPERHRGNYSDDGMNPRQRERIPYRRHPERY